jgi:hypothetical protein
MRGAGPAHDHKFSGALLWRATLRHLDINGWYSTPNAKYDGLSPRDYLRDKSWDEQMQVGLSVLKQHRVIQ